MSARKTQGFHTMARSIVVKGVECPSVLDETSLFSQVVTDCRPQATDARRLNRRTKTGRQNGLARNDDARNLFASAACLSAAA